MIRLLNIKSDGWGFLAEADKQMVKLTFARFLIYNLQFTISNFGNWKLEIENRKSEIGN
jgi:hypothetical protein